MGLLNTGSRLGAAFGLWGMSLSVSRFGWRFSFLVLGLAGAVWALSGSCRSVTGPHPKSRIDRHRERKQWIAGCFVPGVSI
jgi:hypothetical protein